VTTPVQTVAPETHAGDRVHGAKMSNGRLEFLDALRGIAALVVAVQHLGEVIWPQLVVFSHVWWRPGEFGVLVFFICSGFIIPASMERRGNLSEFWIGRVFRLFPLYLTVLVLGLIAFATPWAAPRPDYAVVSDSLLNATMLQVFSTRPIVIGASWTLGYEMVFYLLMTVLFMLGWHRRSAGISVGLVTAALVFGVSLVPYFLVQTQIRHWPAVVIGLVALAVAVIAPRLAGRQRAVALSITVLILMLFLNRPNDLWFSLLLLASMFVGTVLYRYDIGEVSKRTAATVFCFAVGGIILIQYCYQVGVPEETTGATPNWWTEAGTFVSAYLLFGGLFLLRRYAYPRVLVYAGTISYSVYLVHALVLLLPTPPLAAVPAFAVLMTATLAISVLTYHLIEKPGQLLGRRMIARYRERKGGAAAQVPPAEPVAEQSTPASPGPEAGDTDREVDIAAAPIGRR
jgi:peptidoglycan/LPS O-acetylase OafA/YrhL